MAGGKLWEAWEDEALVKLRDAPRGEMAVLGRQLGRTANALRHRASKQRMRLHETQRRWTDAEDALLLAIIRAGPVPSGAWKQIGAQIGRTQLAVGIRAAVLRAGERVYV